MSSQRGYVEIPIQREEKTFEKRRRDRVNNLEHTSLTKKGKHMEQVGEQKHSQIEPFRDTWFDELNDWAISFWRRWDDEMHRMRNSMFALLPVEQFGIHTPIMTSEFELPVLMNQMERHLEEMRERMGLMNQNITGSTSDYLKDAYEVGEDGLVRFNVRFNAGGFAPEEIKVTSNDHCLMVLAKKTEETDKAKSSREFCRIIELPRSIEHTQLKCNLTEDGILELEAPVKAPDYKSLTFNENHQLGIRPKSEGDVKSTPECTTLAVKGLSGPTVIEDGDKEKHLHIEVPVDSIFKPEDLCVNVDSNRIVITGRHHKMSGSRMDRSKSMAEFKQWYEIPNTVDPLSMKAQLIGNTLVIEAPMNMEHKVEHKQATTLTDH